MMKTDLIKAAKISTNAMAKLWKNEDIRLDEILVKTINYVLAQNDIESQSIIPEDPKV